MSKQAPEYYIKVHESHDMEKYKTPTCYMLRCKKCAAECYEDHMVIDPNMHTRNRQKLIATCEGRTS